MSYCRFENTLTDLRDCADALETEEEQDIAKMSGWERAARTDLIALCCEIARKYGRSYDAKG
jgi:hypothetical protein